MTSSVTTIDERGRKITVTKNGATIVHTLVNPVTRFDVSIEPQFMYHDEKQFTEFHELFTQWCKVMWMIGRMSPETFIAERGWVHASPFYEYGKGLTPPAEEA